MSTGGGAASSSSRSTSVRHRALHSLVKLRDVAKEIFRNLQQVSRTAREEPGGAERAETLRTQRENYIQLLCSFQTELRESVGELDEVMEGKRKLVGMKKKIEDHETALRKFGKGLKDAERMLSDVLQRTSDGVHCSTSDEPAELDIDDLIRFSHVISYSTGAQEGFEPNSVLTSALPPAPHSEMMARSRLFAAERPSRVLADQGAGAGQDGILHGEGQVGSVALGKRTASKREAEDEMLKIWSHPLPADDMPMAEAADADAALERPEKRRAFLLPLASCTRESPPKDKQLHERSDAKVRDGAIEVGGSENAGCNQREDSCIEMPKMPTWWRPGMPISVALPRASDPAADK